MSQVLGKGGFAFPAITVMFTLSNSWWVELLKSVGVGVSGVVGWALA